MSSHIDLGRLTKTFQLFDVCFRQTEKVYKEQKVKISKRALYDQAVDVYTGSTIAKEYPLPQTHSYESFCQRNLMIDNRPIPNEDLPTDTAAI